MENTFAVSGVYMEGSTNLGTVHLSVKNYSPQTLLDKT